MYKQVIAMGFITEFPKPGESLNLGFHHFSLMEVRHTDNSHKNEFM